MIGPGSIEDHIRHAEAFAAAFETHRRRAPDRAADLGSGGGLPGLVLAARWKSTPFSLIDSSATRTKFLARAVASLGLEHVAVLHARAEQLGRETAHRGRYELVAARSFGPPAVTAECGAPLLAPEGLLIASDPPDAFNRWPAEALLVLGLVPFATRADPALTLLRQATPCPERFPRRTGVPERRPLW